MMTMMIRRVMSLGMALAAVITAYAQPARVDPFEESYTYYDNIQLGERIVVKFAKAENDLARSIEMTLFDESYYNQASMTYEKRQIALFTGMGMGSTGLKMVVSDQAQRNQFINVLERFDRTLEAFKSHEETLIELKEDWMGDSWNTLALPRRLGTVYFYPTRKSMDATFNFDPEMNRIWLSMGARVFVDNEVVPYILKMLRNLGVYQDKFVSLRNEVRNRNNQIDGLLGVDRVRSPL